MDRLVSLRYALPYAVYRIRKRTGLWCSRCILSGLRYWRIFFTVAKYGHKVCKKPTSKDTACLVVVFTDMCGTWRDSLR